MNELGRYYAKGLAHINRNSMTAFNGHVLSSSLEHFLGMLFGANAHIFLTQSPHLGVDIVMRLKGSKLAAPGL